MTESAAIESRTIRRTATVAAIGITQTLAWGSSYYLPAILADDMARAIGVPRTWVFAAFSASLLLAAVLGPSVGRAIDRRGGSGVLVASNVVLAAGLVGLSLCTGIATLVFAWAVIGVGMALGLYDAAFATLAGIYGREARGPITGITLIAGFASTVGWPLSALLDASFGWRGACLAWAGINVIIGLPLNLLLIPRPPGRQGPKHQGAVMWEPRKEMILLAYVFAASWFVTGAMAAHLPTLLERMGATTVQAIAAAALVGPAQVAARLAEFLIMRHIHPLVSARLAASMHPIGAATLVVLGSPAATIFALLHGAGNGLLTIARGTVPLALFGPEGYGARTGLLGAPARAAQAAAPLLFGVLLDVMGPEVLAVSGGLCLSALAALLVLKATSAPAPAQQAKYERDSRIADAGTAPPPQQENTPMKDCSENSVYNVLFLCTGNSARSIIAEAILNRVGQGKFRAFSAGSHPKGRIHPYTLDLLQQLHFDVSGLRSKSWTEFAVSGAPKLDFVFTVCDNAAGETCPVWPGQPMTAHWSVPDPAEAEGSPAEIALAFKDAYRTLNQRIGIFTALPIRRLDRLSLQKRLSEIGNMKGPG